VTRTRGRRTFKSAPPGCVGESARPLSTDPYAYPWAPAGAPPPAYGPPPSYPPPGAPYPPGAYYPPPAYAMPPGYYPGQPIGYPYGGKPAGSAAAIAAGICWILLIVRDIAVALVASLAGGFPFFPFFMGADMAWLFLLPLVSAAAAGVATYTDFTRRHFEVGTAAGIVAVVGGAFPGILVIGPFGAAFGIAAMAMHVVARKSFGGREPYAPHYG